MIRWGPELTEDSDALKKAKARLAAKVDSPRPWEAPPTAPLVAGAEHIEGDGDLILHR